MDPFTLALIIGLLSAFLSGGGKITAKSALVGVAAGVGTYALAGGFSKTTAAGAIGATTAVGGAAATADTAAAGSGGVVPSAMVLPSGQTATSLLGTVTPYLAAAGVGAAISNSVPSWLWWVGGGLIAYTVFK